MIAVKTVRINGVEVLLKSHDGGRSWFSHTADMITEKRNRKKQRQELRTAFLNAPVFSNERDIFPRGSR